MAGAADADVATAPSGPGDPPPVTWRQWLGFLAMGVGMFMAMLDIQIVSSSLAQIQGGLMASPDEVSWVQTSYLVAEVIMIPLSGYLARLLSTHVLFSLSALGFSLASLGCASATSLEAMIAFRALQGFAGGAMIPLVFATGFTLFPGKRQAAVSVAMGMIVTMAPALGPSVGGYITEQLSWQWLFIINVIPGFLVASTVWSLIRIDQGDRRLLRTLDVPGLVWLAVFLGSLQYVLEEGPENRWLYDPEIFVVSMISAVAGVLFLSRVFSCRAPIVDLRVFSNRNFAIGSFYNFTLGIGLWGMLFLMPLFLAWVRDYNSFQIGMIMLVTGACMFLSAPLAGFLTRLFDLRVMLGVGLLMISLSIYLNCFLTSESGFWELFLPQVLRGLSLMICLIPANMLALGMLRPDQLGNASGLYVLSHSLGGAIGLAAINAVLIARTAVHETQLAAGINLQRAVARFDLGELSGAGETLESLQALRLLAEIVKREATVLAFNDVIQFLALAVAVTLALLPFIRMPRPQAGAEPQPA